MKINWFSPLPPASTDIAHYSFRILPELSKRVSTVLWTDQERYDSRLDAIAAVKRFRSPVQDWQSLNRADISFFHIGNNPLFHRGIWETSQVHPGIVVLHDFKLHHFFDGIYRVHRRDRAAYLDQMERLYGAEGRKDAAVCYDIDAVNINEMAEKYPLTELAIGRAAGVLVHTRDAFEGLSRVCEVPVGYAPLPFPPYSDDGLSEKRYSSRGPFRLIVFGYLGVNRRIDQVLEALATHPGREKLCLDIVGELWDQRHLRRKIGELGLKGQVTVHGFVSEERLNDALANAHLAINLRYPTMGEASGSQLRIWSHALPSLVTRTGWYGSLPDDVVCFVSPDNEIEDIKGWLTNFLEDPPRFAEMGMAGRRLLEAQHSTAQYAESIVAFADRVLGFRQISSAQTTSRRAGNIMGELRLPVSHDDSSRIARLILDTFKEGSGKRPKGRA